MGPEEHSPPDLPLYIYEVVSYDARTMVNYMDGRYIKKKRRGYNARISSTVHMILGKEKRQTAVPSAIVEHKKYVPHNSDKKLRIKVLLAFSWPPAPPFFFS